MVWSSSSSKQGSDPANVLQGRQSDGEWTLASHRAIWEVQAGTLAADPVSWVRIRHYLSENGSGEPQDSHGTNERQKGRCQAEACTVFISRCQCSQWVAVHWRTKAKGSDDPGQPVTNRQEAGTRLANLPETTAPMARY